MKSYSWMKLLLDPTKSNSLTSENLDLMKEDGLMAIPSFKQGASEVCSDYLREIYRYTISYLEKRLGAGVVQASPLDFWFTIPAMWSDKAKEDTLRVALNAGFKSRPKDEITIITEPEAAAIATLTTLSDEENAYDVIAGDNILICDCGGGTVDIITYLVNQTSPVFKFEELLVGIGGKCGSTFIDRNFQRWMARTFKSAWENLKPEKKGPGSRLMRDFEVTKRDFGTQGTLDKRFEIEFVIPNASDSEHYDADEGLIILTGFVIAASQIPQCFLYILPMLMNNDFSSAEMKSFFRPVILQIEKLLEDQIRQLNKDKPGSKIKVQ